MELQNDIYGQDYEKSKLLIIEEDIYLLKYKKRMLEFDLCGEEFKNEHISIRQRMASSEGRMLLGVCIPLTIMIISCIIGIIGTVNSPGNATTLLLSVLAFAMGIYPCISMWKKYFQIMRQFFSMKEMVGKGSDTPTFWLEKEITKKKIEDFKQEINSIIDKIAELSAEKTRIKEEEKLLSPSETLRQELEKKYGLFSELIIKNHINEARYQLNIQKKDVQNRIEGLEKGLEDVNRKTVVLYNDFEIIKSKLYRYIIFFFLFILIQTICTGKLQLIVAIIGVLYTLGGAFYLYQISKDSLILMILEKKPDLFRTYAFHKNIISLYDRRMKIIKELSFFENRLEEIEDKLANLE